MARGRKIIKCQCITLKVMMCRFIYKERDGKKINKKADRQRWIPGITAIPAFLLLATPTSIPLNRIRMQSTLQKKLTRRAHGLVMPT